MQDPGRADAPGREPDVEAPLPAGIGGADRVHGDDRAEVDRPAGEVEPRVDDDRDGRDGEHGERGPAPEAQREPGEQDARVAEPVEEPARIVGVLDLAGDEHDRDRESDRDRPVEGPSAPGAQCRMHPSTVRVEDPKRIR